MLVTINTDASFSYSLKMGTFAYWITCNLGRIKRSGVLRGKTSDPTQAEMKCIVNALHDLSTNEEASKSIKKIIVNTDSLNSIHIFTDNTEAKLRYNLVQQKYSMVRGMYRKIKEEKFAGVNIIFCHLRSHQHTDTSANWVNQWCDDNAKMEMQKLKSKKHNEKQKQHANTTNNSASPRADRGSVPTVNKSNGEKVRQR